MSRANWLTEAFGAAIADIAHKVVEEGTYGRQITPNYRPGAGEEGPDLTVNTRPYGDQINIHGNSIGTVNFAKEFGWDQPSNGEVLEQGLEPARENIHPGIELER